MGRLLRGTFKLALLGAAIGGAVAVARKLMGGLGPEPGSAAAPGEWPSLVPEPSPSTASDNGSAEAGPVSTPPVDPAESATATAPPERTNETDPSA
jgi:hypothetical protein